MKRKLIDRCIIPSLPSKSQSSSQKKQNKQTGNALWDDSWTPGPQLFNKLSSKKTSHKGCFHHSGERQWNLRSGGKWKNQQELAIYLLERGEKNNTGDVWSVTHGRGAGSHEMTTGSSGLGLQGKRLSSFWDTRQDAVAHRTKLSPPQVEPPLYNLVKSLGKPSNGRFFFNPSRNKESFSFSVFHTFSEDH